MSDQKVCAICDKKIYAKQRWTTVKDGSGTWVPVHLDCKGRV